MKHESLLPLKQLKKTQSAFKSKDDYQSQLKALQVRMLDMQQMVRRKKLKVAIVLEGSDAAGKGGIIKRLTELLDPRGFRVYGIGAPNEIESKQNYMQRFFAKFPEEGVIAIFDRSWYGRVLVERVESLIPKKDWKRAYKEITAIEKMLTDDGVLILKYCLDISFAEQQERFEERGSNPLKKWKLTDDDWRNRKKWNQYMPAFAGMVEHTSSEAAPWTIIAAESKWFARVTVLQDIEKRAKPAFGKF